MNEISSSPSGITRISVNQTQNSIIKSPIERFKSKINLKSYRKDLNDVSVQVDNTKERPISFSLFRDDTILNTNLIENIKLKIDKISEELDLAKPKLYPENAKKGKPFLEKSKLIVVNLTPKPEQLMTEKQITIPKKPNVFQTQMQHETPNDLEEKYFLNSTENQIYSANILTDNKVVNKKNTLNRIEELKIDDNQTPISTSFKSKSLERNMEMSNDLVLKNMEQNTQINSQNITRIEDINKKPKSNFNEVLKIKALNYFDNIISKTMTKPVEVVGEKKIVKHDDKQVQTFGLQEMNTHTIETQTDMSKLDNPFKDVVINVSEKKPHQSPEIERDIFKLNKSNNEILERLETSTKRLETFYNGRKSWTVVCEIDENENDKDEKNSDNDNEIDTSDKIVLVDPEQNQNKKKKKNLSVKIKLPDNTETKEDMEDEVKKTRSAQKCCHLFFLIILFFITVAVLAYFLVWNFIMESQRVNRVQN